MMMDYRLLGKNIRLNRREKGITQEVLAEFCNLSPVFISQIENGMRKPSLETVDNIASVLNVSVDSLIHGKEHSADFLRDFELILRNHTRCEIKFSYEILKKILDGLEHDRLCPSQNEREL